MRATRRLDPPTLTNLIAMAAPSGGEGPYTPDEIAYTLTAAYTGFRAARRESEDAAAVVHTGYWGCGAFGGHRELMAMLQILAADMAGIGRLVFHTVTPAGSAVLESARRRMETELEGPSWRPADLIARITSMRYLWGTSDGN
jgi:hypothetical protein